MTTFKRYTTRGYATIPLWVRPLLLFKKEHTSYEETPQWRVRTHSKQLFGWTYIIKQVCISAYISNYHHVFESGCPVCTLKGRETKQGVRYIQGH